MNSDKKFDMRIESLVLDVFIKNQAAKDSRKVRELAIQNSKLNRMLWATNEDPPHATGRSTKKLAKQRGKRDKAIGEQHKKVRSLLQDFIRATALKLNPLATRSDIRMNISFMEELQAASLQSIKKQLMERVAAKPPSVHPSS